MGIPASMQLEVPMEVRSYHTFGHVLRFLENSADVWPNFPVPEMAIETREYTKDKINNTPLIFVQMISDYTIIM